MPIDSGYKHRRDILTQIGFLSWEAREIARNYNMEQLKTLPYLQSLIKSRRLTVINFLRRGLTMKEIRERILEFYKRRNLMVGDRPDIWSLIRSYRKRDIDSGDYKPVKRGGTHHPKGSGISKGNLAEQRKKRSHHKSKTFGGQYEEKQGR
jgi:hypothetical protein